MKEYMALNKFRDFFKKNDWEKTSDALLARKAKCSVNKIKEYRKRLGLFRRKYLQLKKQEELEEFEKNINKTILRNKLKKEIACKMKEKYGFYKI